MLPFLGERSAREEQTTPFWVGAERGALLPFWGSVAIVAKTLMMFEHIKRQGTNETNTKFGGRVGRQVEIETPCSIENEKTVKVSIRRKKVNERPVRTWYMVRHTNGASIMNIITSVCYRVLGVKR